MSPHNRQNCIFALQDDYIDEESQSTLRYDDTIITVDESTGIIKELYGFKGHVFDSLFGTWNATTKALSVPKRSKWERRADMQGQILKVTILPWFPLAINVTKDYDVKTQWSGLFIDVLMSLKEKLNFKIKYTSPSDSIWGIKVTLSNIIIIADCIIAPGLDTYSF